MGVIFAGTAKADARHIDIIRVHDSINPGTEDFIAQAVKRAGEGHAECIVILLNTPGGLMTSMRNIVQSILNSEVPVVVYVHPAGAQAASAGVFITMAADIAAMAPGTNIGAAHPVSSGGGNIPSTMDEKVMNDMLALGRSVANRRGRNAHWMEEAVRRSVSATAEEAYRENVVDLVVEDLPALLARLDGWELIRKGHKTTLHTKGAEQRMVEAGWKNEFLNTISDPNIAYILLMIGLAGLYFELSQPGAVLPGVVGGMSLVLALYSMHTLPVDYAGLIILAVIFFLLEIKIASYGILSLAGTASLAMGSLMLFRFPQQGNRLTMSVFIPVLLAVSAFFIMVASLAYRAQKLKPKSGAETLVGLVGEVRKELAPNGKVFVAGELWNAEADEKISAGESVVIISVSNLKLKVKRNGGTEF